MKSGFVAAALLLSFLSEAAERQWTLFESPDLTGVDLAAVKKIPRTLGGIKGKKVTIPGKYAFKRSKYTVRECAVFFCELEVPEAQKIVIGCGADYFFELRVNGVWQFDTLKYGNRGHYPPKATDYLTEVDLKRGKNLICILLQSGDGSFELHTRFFPPRNPALEMRQFAKLSDRIAKTDMMKINSARKQVMAVIQNGVDNMRNPVFHAFDSQAEMEEGKLKEFYEKQPVLLYYDRALDRILAELPKAEVPKGGVILWHLYNMGYVVKTEHCCFGIDLHHRRAKLLAPHIDFLLTTHNHEDHYNMALLKEMAQQGKSIYSNFYPCKGFSHGNSTVKIKDLTITMEETDHNATLKGFVKTFQIRCGDQPGACVIYHTGDSRDVTQLNPYGKVDIFIPHPKVGLNCEDACKKFRPELTLLSHMLEMGHCWPSQWFPVPFDMELKDDMPKIKALNLKCAIPLWGEKIVWKP